MKYRARRGLINLASYVIVIGTVIGSAGIATFVLGRTYSELALQKEPFDRNEYTPSFDPIEDATLGVSPNSGNAFASGKDKNIRAVEVFPTQTLLLAGGKAIRTINQATPPTLHALVATVHDPRYLSEDGSTVTVRSAIILQHSAMVIAAPTTRQVVLRVARAVFLAANNHSTLKIDHVYVHASDTKTPNSLLLPTLTEGRPFVMAVADSQMNVDRSVFRYLGRDWNTSYGLSWSKGATGSVTNSQLDHNFIGVYSNGSPKLRVAHNTLSYNSLYGIDPHSGSTHMDIEYNTADHNGRHGIIFSDHVTASVVKYNVTDSNGLNGIMMDQFSSGNQISDNQSQYNQSDGIVLASSSGNILTSNHISYNRIGITVRGTTVDTIAIRNVITRNKKAVQGLSTSRNSLSNNGGEWRWDRIATIWQVAGLIIVLLASITWVAQRRNPRRQVAYRRREVVTT